jgi:hypothetical protein
MQDARAAIPAPLEAELLPPEIYDVAEHELTVLPSRMSLLHGMEKPPARRHILLAYSGWFAAAVMLGAMVYVSRFSSPAQAVRSNELQKSGKIMSASPPVAASAVVGMEVWTTSAPLDEKESFKLSEELSLLPAR